MKTLQSAWKWYSESKSQIRLMERLATHHWAGLPWDGPLGKDEHFRRLEAVEIQSQTQFTLEHLDDIAIVVLFSVFEAIVRDCIRVEVEAEIPMIHHPSLKFAAQETVEWIDEG